MSERITLEEARVVLGHYLDRCREALECNSPILDRSGEFCKYVHPVMRWHAIVQELTPPPTEET